ncbi:5'-methylthioadenosine/S-adenosylhomocysteine nucleosidase-like isoform X1 [Acropora millepora]|uniref:5'-methylthioadenosine/S-adenosylhomocysteine nucleosidase-like isoform X1 n=1 Tax=Acropora millepora TaxID=45264 RepID=UPI001CF1864F|nr:5'-methylthioadenosine/S-adenosylhomocysteine nucleosidase-like isoform X1 [Acropora millepora]XP_044174657.1 5'-methylthioadenosine/S-adenosylhomocysteine nucleosidase-like isoform X1 [Acropora millepora]
MDWEDITSFARYTWNAVTRIREWIFAMSGAAAQSDSSGASLSNPPEVDFVVLKAGDITSDSVPWELVDVWIDILLLTAKDCEFLSCLSYFNPGFYKTHEVELGFVYLGEMGNGDVKLKVALIMCNMGAGIPQGSTIVVPKAVRALHPKAVISVGYCAGLKGNKVKFGDVIISSKLATYAPIKVTRDGIIERGVQVSISPRLSRILRHADEGWKAPKNSEDLEVKVHKDGLLLSGPEVVSSDERRMELIKRYPDAIGVEMEGEGLYAAAQDVGVEWVVIKGVSDFAGDKKSASDHWRPFSSLMAASLVAHVLSNANVFQKWPHYKKPGT